MCGTPAAAGIQTGECGALGRLTRTTHKQQQSEEGSATTLGEQFAFVADLNVTGSSR